MKTPKSKKEAIKSIVYLSMIWDIQSQDFVNERNRLQKTMDYFNKRAEKANDLNLEVK